LSGGGDFNNRDTFRDGKPILRMNYRQQVIRLKVQKAPPQRIDDKSEVELYRNE
jgi:hypothetical protein